MNTLNDPFFQEILTSLENWLMNDAFIDKSKSFCNEVVYAVEDNTELDLSEGPVQISATGYFEIEEERPYIIRITEITVYLEDREIGEHDLNEEELDRLDEVVNKCLL